MMAPRAGGAWVCYTLRCLSICNGSPSRDKHEVRIVCCGALCRDSGRFDGSVAGVATDFPFGADLSQTCDLADWNKPWKERT